MQYLCTFNSLDSLDSCVTLHKVNAKVKQCFETCKLLINENFTGVLLYEQISFIGKQL